MIKKRILVVEDNQMVRLALKTNLERAGFDTAIAENGKSALTLLEEQTYDLTLTDYFMPGINGLVLMLQAKELYPKMKVIIFSGLVDEGLVEKFLALGADGFFHKPLNIDDLLKRIIIILAPYTTVQK